MRQNRILGVSVAPKHFQIQKSCKLQRLNLLGHFRLSLETFTCICRHPKPWTIAVRATESSSQAQQGGDLPWQKDVGLSQQHVTLLDSHAAAPLHEAPAAFSLHAPLNLYWDTSASSRSWLRDAFCVFFDILEPNPLVRGSQEVLPRSSGRRLMTRISCSPSCDFPGPFSFSFCFAMRGLPALLLSAGLSELASDVKFPNSESFWSSLRIVSLWDPLPFPADNLLLVFCGRNALSKGNTKAWEHRLFAHGEGDVYDMWICQMLPLRILLKYALYWPRLLYLYEEGVGR